MKNVRCVDKKYRFYSSLYERTRIFSQNGKKPAKTPREKTQKYFPGYYPITDHDSVASIHYSKIDTCIASKDLL
jgi:hypothetical protein